MVTETIAEVDAQIINARWRWLHGVWDGNEDQVTRAKLAIDVLLDKRCELMKAVDVAA